MDGNFTWDVPQGAWHGLDWMNYVLPAQTKVGDNVYAPFVSAGWSEREELNFRPGQWLGFLKSLAVSGAEYFNVGFQVCKKHVGASNHTRSNI